MVKCRAQKKIKILKIGISENCIINKKADSEEIRYISLSQHKVTYLQNGL